MKVNTRWLRVLVACSFVLAPSAHAQVGLPQLDDATVVPRGLVRLRAMTVWSRFESRFTSSGEESLGASFTSNALGRAQIRSLFPIDSLVSEATGRDFVLSLGQSRLDARGRHEIVPIGIEYGLTNRVTVGVVLPVVRRRVTVQFRLDSTGATVGPNLHRTQSAANSTNALLQTQFAAAASQLQNRLTSCQANPAGAGCSALLARQAEAQALIASSTGFASAIGALYGTAGTNGMAFVPTANSPAQADITFRVGDFNSRYRDLLGSGTDLLTAIPVAAAGPAGSSELQNYLTNELGGDSLATEERTGWGDIELGVKMLLFDRIRDSTTALGMRATATLVYRFGTSSQQSPSPIADLRLGHGGNAVESRAALDLHAGRFGVLAAADFATTFEEEPPWEVLPFGPGPPLKPDSRWLGIHLAPRFHLSPLFAIHGAWSMRSANESGSESYAGGGVTYSTLPAFLARGGPLPMEMRFTHLESLSGPAGAPKYVRDQVELRIYFGR